jgi:hypothetical protein
MRHDPDGRIVEVGARTRTIPPDVGWAIDVLHPRALQPVAAGE